MNGNDQFDDFSSQSHEFQNPEEIISSNIKSKNYSARRYIRVDTEHGNLSFTSDKTTASSLKQIHQFVLSNFMTLNKEELDFFLEGGLNHLVKKKSGVFGLLYNKINTAKHFILNSGKTNSRLINEIQEKAIYQSFENQFNQNLENNSLKEKLDAMISLQRELKKYQSQMISSLPPSSKKKISREIERIKDLLTIYQRDIQQKENRQQIKIILKKIKPAQDDNLFIREIKNQFLNEKKEYIEIMQSIHMQFNPMAEVKLVFEEPVESHVLQIETNFSDRFTKRSEVIDGYYLRDPSDLSVLKSVEAYFKT